MQDIATAGLRVAGIEEFVISRTVNAPLARVWTTMVLSLEEHGPIAGMASALGGTLQMLTGGVAIVIMSAFFDGTVLPMVTAIALCALAAAGFAWVTLGRPHAVPQAAE